MNPPSPSSARRRGIYILPNLLTTAALFCGYFAIVQAMNQNFGDAAIAIFIAMVFDGLDGRVARLTGTQSEFGVQYDSLSDMVSFGIAPALLAYQWALMDLDRLGWIVSFVYCSSAALRLARFNTNVGVIDKRFFQGLPSPAAAALIAGMVWLSAHNGISPKELAWLKTAACALTFIAGISMVSNFPFWSGKNINLRKSVPFIAVIALALAFALGALYPPGVFFGLFVSYALSGYVLAFWRWRRRRKAAAAAARAWVAELSSTFPDGEAAESANDPDDPTQATTLLRHGEPFEIASPEENEPLPLSPKESETLEAVAELLDTLTPKQEKAAKPVKAAPLTKPPRTRKTKQPIPESSVENPFKEE